jgi:hypothetical protein
MAAAGKTVTPTPLAMSDHQPQEEEVEDAQPSSEEPSERAEGQQKRRRQKQAETLSDPKALLAELEDEKQQEALEDGLVDETLGQQERQEAGTWKEQEGGQFVVQVCTGKGESRVSVCRNSQSMMLTTCFQQKQPSGIWNL